MEQIHEDKQQVLKTETERIFGTVFKSRVTVYSNLETIYVEHGYPSVVPDELNAMYALGYRVRMIAYEKRTISMWFQRID